MFPLLQITLKTLTCILQLCTSTAMLPADPSTLSTHRVWLILSILYNDHFWTSREVDVYNYFRKDTTTTISRKDTEVKSVVQVLFSHQTDPDRNNRECNRLGHIILLCWNSLQEELWYHTLLPTVFWSMWNGNKQCLIVHLHYLQLFKRQI